MRFTAVRLAWLPLMGALAYAEEVVYVTDLAIFTLLAPCVQDALGYDVMSMTNENCAEAVTELQSCICSKDGFSSSLSSQISVDVGASCASTASSDQASAKTVLSAYCNQATAVTFPSPTITVSQYITDVPEMQYLAPCAYSQVSYAVMDMTDGLCPPDAEHLATCVCQKNQNSLMVSASINAAVGNACSSQTADISSAQAFYKAYCNLNSGTSSFPSASDPPGDMSYYITDIPQFTSLAKCAQTALSEAVFTQTYELCPDGPQYLASCACIKPSMSSVVNSYITSGMSWSCSSNSAAFASSALNIFALYCSAARGDTVLADVTASVAQTQPFGLGAAATGTATATGTKATATGKSGATTSTGGNSNGGSGSGGSSSDSTGSNSSSSSSASDDSGSTSHTAVIAGAVVGVVGGLALLAAAAYFVFRHVRKNKNKTRPVGGNSHDFQQLDNLTPAAGADMYNGKSELAGTPFPAEVAGTTPGPSPSPSAGGGKYNNMPGSVQLHSPSTSPGPQQGGYNYAYPPPPAQAELQGQMYSPNGPYPPQQNYAELQAQSLPHAQAELYGSGSVSGEAAEPYSPLHQQHPVYQADSTPIESPSRTTPMSGGMSFHSGPVPQTFSELDSNAGNQGHAR